MYLKLVDKSSDIIFVLVLTECSVPISRLDLRHKWLFYVLLVPVHILLAKRHLLPHMESINVRNLHKIRLN